MKYPTQIISLKRPEKVLAVDAALFCQTEDSPLEIHNGFSRFVVSIVDKKQGITPSANIPARDVSAIYEKSKAAVNHLVEKALTPTLNAVDSENNEATSPGLAATEKIFLKPFSGKTPLEILTADANNKAELERLRDQVLTPNASRYPKNKVQIDAINEAIQLLENGNLNTTAQPVVATSEKPYPIYTTEYKYKSAKNDKGYSLVYSINIIFDSSRDNPFTVNIQNCYAPVETLADGRKNIAMGRAEDFQKGFFSLTTEEFFELVSVMKNTKERFEEMNFPTQFELMKANSYQHKESPKDNNSR